MLQRKYLFDCDEAQNKFWNKNNDACQKNVLVWCGEKTSRKIKYLSRQIINENVHHLLTFRTFSEWYARVIIVFDVFFISNLRTVPTNGKYFFPDNFLKFQSVHVNWHKCNDNCNKVSKSATNDISSYPSPLQSFAYLYTTCPQDFLNCGCNMDCKLTFHRFLSFYRVPRSNMLLNLHTFNELISVLCAISFRLCHKCHMT